MLRAELSVGRGGDSSGIAAVEKEAIEEAGDEEADDEEGNATRQSKGLIVAFGIQTCGGEDLRGSTRSDRSRVWYCC